MTPFDVPDVPTTPTERDPDPVEAVTGISEPIAVPVTAAEPLAVVAVPAHTAQTAQQPIAAGAPPAMVLGAHPRRRSVVIVNTGSATVTIGFDAGVTSSHGFPLLAGAGITVEVRAALWAVADVAGGRLALLAQYEDG